MSASFGIANIGKKHYHHSVEIANIGESGNYQYWLVWKLPLSASFRVTNIGKSWNCRYLLELPISARNIIITFAKFGY